MKRKEIIEVLTKLKDNALLRSNMITEDGVEITDLQRAVAKAYANAYDFSIMLLEQEDMAR